MIKKIICCFLSCIMIFCFTSCGKCKEDEHSYEYSVTKEATCTQDGIRVLKCQRESCGKTMDTVIKAKGHSWDNGVVNKAATCAQEGELLVTCTVCGEKQINVIPKLPHKYSGTVTPPTCTEQGYTEYFCSER